MLKLYLVDWFYSHRELVLVFVSSTLVSLPILVGYGVGHIPKRTAFAILGSVFFFSLLSISIIFWMNHQKRSLPQFLLSTLFGLFWILSSLRMEHKNESFLRKIRWMFLSFGVTWIGITVYQYANQQD